MAKIEERPTVQVEGYFVLSEAEMRALDALTGYGIEPFLETFYEKMGRHYLSPHEHGLRDLFKTVRGKVPGILRRADIARKAFNDE